MNVHQALVRRAEEAGQSLQQVPSQIAEIAATRTMKDIILDRIGQRPKCALSAAAAIEALEEERARR